MLQDTVQLVFDQLKRGQASFTSFVGQVLPKSLPANWVLSVDLPSESIRRVLETVDAFTIEDARSFSWTPSDAQRVAENLVLLRQQKWKPLTTAEQGLYIRILTRVFSISRALGNGN